MNRHVLCAAILLTIGNLFGEAPTGWITRFCNETPSLSDPGIMLYEPIKRDGRFADEINPSRKAVLSKNTDTVRTIQLAASTTTSLPTSVSLGIPFGFAESDYPRVKELARALDYNWEKCYRYVRDNIAFTPYVGILRGPERTLLDMEGSDGDQAFLLLALLRASGYAATIEYIPLTDSSAYLVPLWHYNSKYTYNAADWLGISTYDGMGINDLYQQCYKKLTTSGEGCAYYYDSGNDEYYIATSHFWVLCVVEEGENYYLDPSLKPMATTLARDAKADMGYNRNAIISAAGGTVGSTFVKNLSSENLAKQLNTYSANLRKVWTNANANASTYVGSQKVLKQNDDSYWNAAVSGTVYDFLAQSEATINNFRGVVTLTHGSISKQFYLDEIADRNLWLSYQSSSTKYPKAILKLDDATVAAESTGSATEEVSMNIKVAYPAASDQSYTLKRDTNNTYVIPVAFDGDNRNGMRKVMMDKLSDVCTKGYDANDGRVVSLAMQAVGQQWATQTALLNRLRNRLQGNDYRCFYNFGVAGWENGPYVDLKNSFSRRMDNHQLFDGYGLFYSALEHASLDQVLGTNTPSISTIRVLDLANKAGNNIYFMTSNNYSTVGNALSGYSSSLVAQLKNSAKGGMRYLIPASGAINLNSWTGYGYVQHGVVSGTEYVTAMLISGNRNGAKSTMPATLLSYRNSDYYDTSYYDASTTATFSLYAQKTDYSAAQKTAATVYPTYTADPINMPSGAFTDSATDLTINAATPLIWKREYDSRQNGHLSEMGYGWTHNYDITANEITAVDATFGAYSSDAVIPTVVAISVVDDLLADQESLSDKENARRWMIAALTVQWWTERMTATAVSIDIGNSTMQFQLLDDGTYAPYPGVTAELKKQNGNYVLTERLGSSYYFNVSNRLSKIVDHSGNEITLTYTDGKLTGVVNEYGGKFTINYSGDLISSVQDNAGHTVKYFYVNDCLTQITDPLSWVWRNDYDAVTRLLVKQTDPDGNITVQNSYNDFDQVTKQVDANGKIWLFGYIGGNEAWEEDPLNRRNSQTYDDDGRIMTRLERDGTSSQLTYDGHGHIANIIDAIGRIDDYVYDNNDNIIWISEASGKRKEVYVYDDDQRLVVITNAMGYATTFEYDSKDRPIKEIFPDNTALVNVWSDKGLLLSETFLSATGRILKKTDFEYGDLGLPIKRTVSGIGIPTAGYEERMTYDSVGNLLSTTDANGNTTYYSYTSRNQVNRIIDPLSNTTTITYGKNGRLTAEKSPRNYTTNYRWTASGKLASTLYADNSAVTNVYDEIDNLAQVIDERGSSVFYKRDAMGRIVETTNSTGSDIFVYNSVGLLASHTNRLGLSTTLYYDILYRNVETIDGMGNSWQTGYNNFDKPTVTLNPLNKLYQRVYNEVGRAIATGRPSGAVEFLGYDDFGNCSAYTNSEGHVYTMTFDALGRMTSATNGVGEEVFHAEYDPVGNVLKLCNGRGERAYFYDKCNQMVSRTFDDSNEVFCYDPNGNMTSASNSLGNITFYYDQRDRLNSASFVIFRVDTPRINRQLWSYRYSRDLAGNITNICLSGTSYNVSREYDSVGNLISVTDWANHKWTFEYDAAGKIIALKAPNGVRQTYTYDRTEQLVGLSVGEIAKRTITRDSSGKRVQDRIEYGPVPKPTSTLRSENAYNAADRLISATIIDSSGVVCKEAYEYDSTGALTNVLANEQTVFSAKYNGNGFISAINNKQVKYDALDNRVLFNDHIWIFDYTDPLSRPLVECSMSGHIIRYYIWAGAHLLGFIDETGELIVAHSDEMGNVIALTTSNGEVVYQANYGPYGEDWGMSGCNPTPFAWLGSYGVQNVYGGNSLGAIYSTRHRLYSSNHRRFISSDPMGLAGGVNLYAYGDFNPLSFVDPLGLCSNYNLSNAHAWEHGVLDTLGFVDFMFIGTFADVASAILYFSEGDKLSAGLSVASAAPLIGNVAAGAKIGKTATKAVSNAGKTTKKTMSATQDFHPPALYNPYNPAYKNGAVPGSTRMTVKREGSTVGRYGSDDGRFLTDPGTPIDKLSIAPGTDTRWYREYKVKRSTNFEQSTVMPDVGQPGLGNQYFNGMAVRELQQSGAIELNTYRFSKYGF